MDTQKLGQFIFELRKANQMTQKDLAVKLNVTDKAVSKWERGLSCPDISLIPDISEIFGITTSELLNGQKSSTALNDIETCIDNALQYADKAVKGKRKLWQNICAAAFSILLLVAIAVCAVCDIAVFGGFTWSLFPIASCVFAWFVFFPVIKLGEKGILGSLIALTITILPFLLVLDYLIEISNQIFPIGIRMSIISVAFLWLVFAIFKIWKGRTLLAAAASFLCAVPVSILINISLSKLIGEPVIDVWDIAVCLVLLIIALILFAVDYAARKRRED